jgi:hypothetical protein
VPPPVEWGTIAIVVGLIAVPGAIAFAIFGTRAALIVVFAAVTATFLRSWWTLRATDARLSQFAAFAAVFFFFATGAFAWATRTQAQVNSSDEQMGPITADASPAVPNASTDAVVPDATADSGVDAHDARKADAKTTVHKEPGPIPPAFQ